MPTPPPRTWRHRLRTLPWGVIGLLVFAGIVRGGVLWVQFGNLKADPDGYRAIAKVLARDGIYGDRKPFPSRGVSLTAYRPPLYPLVLSTWTDVGGNVRPARAAVGHWILGIATVWLSFDLALRMKLGKASYAAALIVACDPILLQQSTLVMTETLAAFLSILALHSLTRFTQQPEAWKALVAGGAIGLAILCRPTYLPWAALVVLVLLGSRGMFFSRKLVAVTAFVTGVSLFVLPWGIRNRVEMGKFIITTTHGGYTFYLGNNHDFYRELRERRPAGYEVLSILAEVEGVNLNNEIEGDAWLYKRAWAHIRREPTMFAYACIYRLYQLVNPLPHPTSENESLSRTLLRYAVAIWYCCVYILTAFGIYKLRGSLFRAPWLWGVTLCLAFAAVHTFYWTNLRMRGPLMPFIALVAAAGAGHLAEPFAHANLLRRKNLRSC